jgi:ribosomal protein S18 acetylase RimI-like enzyme
MKITEMKIADYDEVFSLWKNTEGVGFHKPSDCKKGIAKYLRRNPGLSFIARDGKKIVGTILCGQEGRRGSLYHLAIDKAYRKKGLGKALVQKALSKLASIGITRCMIFVFAKNRNGLNFWKHLGWTHRPDIIMMTKDIGKQNAGKK